MIEASHPRSIVGENHFSARFTYDGTPENLIDLLFRFVLHTQRAVKRKEGAVTSGSSVGWPVA